MRKRISIFFCFFAFWLACFSAKAAPADINDIYVIHFIIDGTNRRFFNEVLDLGKLPTIQKLFVEEGAVFTHALANFPSTSTTIYQSYTTGLFPGFAGIPHLERLDRQSQEVIGYLTSSGYLKINDDFINMRALLNPAVAELNPPTTIFELLEGYPTLSLYSTFRRGASEAFPKKAPWGALWSGYVEDSGERIDLYAYEILFERFKKEDPPRYTQVGLYSTDFLGHEYGVESEWVEAALIQFDLFLKEFWELLKENGLADKTYIIISADHGMHDTAGRFDLKKPLQEAGIFIKPRNPKIKDYTLYVADRGVSSTHLYAKHDGSWQPVEDASVLRRHPKIGGGTIDLIETILNLEPTLLVMARDGPYAARVFDNKGGQSRIECFILDYTDWCSYQVVPGHSDPLNYKGQRRLAHILDGRPHNSLEWKKATADEAYPDAVIQLSQIFFDGRAGDIFVVPQNAWGFRKVKHATHGSIIAEDMRVPFLMRGPNVPSGSFGIMRSPDIYPLMLKWFGLTVPPENHDGIDPFIKIAPESKEWQRLSALEQAVSHNEKINVKTSRHLLKLARQEDRNRKVLLEKLRQKEEELAGRKSSFNNDHLDIIRRMCRLTQTRVERMEKIISILQ